MRISVFGMGYVGVVSGTCLAQLGHDVVGVDINPTKVGLLNEGRSPIVERGLDELLSQAVKAGKLRATADAVEAVLDSDITFISVGTPSEPDGSPSMAAIDAVVAQIGQALRQKSTPHLVVMRSTVPPGTCQERLAPALALHSGRAIGPQLQVCSNPEFLREGSAIQDFHRPPFTLIGADDDEAFARLAGVYAGVDAPVTRAEVRVAESVKYLCNIFHALKITFANEAGTLLKSLGLDGRDAMKIFCNDTILNISTAYLRPGFAFGGSCLPKDLRGFLALARTNGAELPMLNSIIDSNERHIDRAFEMATRLGRKKIALFGLAFKPGTDDLRESPLVGLAERLIGKGYELAIFDRDVEIARLLGSNREFIDHEIPHLEKLMASDPASALAGAEVVVIGHAGKAEVEAIRAAAGCRLVVDLQGVAELAALEGVEYDGICW
jgi:GDP-mannose 6-dehydrogenase